MNDSEFVKLVVELAKEVDLEDPVDFAMLPIDDDILWEMMAAHVVEMFAFTSNMDKTVLMATITKLVVENFVLNARLLQMTQENN